MIKRTSNQALRKFHALGKSVLAAGERRIRSGEGVWGTFDSLGATTAAEKNRLQEARHFAQLYNSRQLDRLCKLGKDVGQPLTKSQVILLLRVADRQQRNSLAQQCAKLAWSARRLEDEVRRVGPRRKYGGRGPAPPPTKEQALVTIERLTSSWCRWVRTLRPRKDTTQPGISQNELTKPIQVQLSSASKKMEQLARTLRRELDRRASKMTQRSRSRRLSSPHNSRI